MSGNSVERPENPATAQPNRYANRFTSRSGRSASPGWAVAQVAPTGNATPAVDSVTRTTACAAWASPATRFQTLRADNRASTRVSLMCFLFLFGSVLATTRRSTTQHRRGPIPWHRFHRRRCRPWDSPVKGGCLGLPARRNRVACPTTNSAQPRRLIQMRSATIPRERSNSHLKSRSVYSTRLATSTSSIPSTRGLLVNREVVRDLYDASRCRQRRVGGRRVASRGRLGGGRRSQRRGSCSACHRALTATALGNPTFHRHGPEQLDRALWVTPSRVRRCRLRRKVRRSSSSGS